MPSEHDDDLLDIISDAIDESMDVDWTSRDGARHVLGALQIGGYIRTAAMDALIADSADLYDAPASADALGEVERVARAIAPMICAPVYNGDCDDVSAGQDYARRVATAALSAMSPAGEVERIVAWLRRRGGQLLRTESSADQIAGAELLMKAGEIERGDYRHD